MPGRVIHQLVTADLANPEIFCLGMRKIKAAHACTGMHRKGFGQLDACVLLRLEQIEQHSFLSVIGTGGITGSRPDAAIFFADKIGLGQLFAAPESPGDPSLLVQIFGKRFR